jgi:hypothetical protein
MTAIIAQQASASSSTLKTESKNDTKIEHMNKGLHMWSGSHTWLHLWSGYHTGLHLGSGNKMRSGEKEHMWTGNKGHLGSGNKLGTWVDKKTEKLGSVFKKMSDDKLTALLIQINTLTTNITDPTLLSIINSIKSLIQQNIGN